MLSKCLPLRRNVWHQLRQRQRSLFTALGVTGCIFLLRSLGWLEVWELAILDQSFRLRPLEPVDERIVLVGIEETDLRQLQRFPIPDGVMAALLRKLKTYQPRAIGLDIYRDLPVEPGHQELLQIYRTTPHLIGIHQIKDSRSQGVLPPPILEAYDRVGFNNLVHDPDSKIRRGLLYWEVDGKSYQSFALKLALIYLKAEAITPASSEDGLNHLQLGKAVFPIFTTNAGGYANADDGGYQFLANLRGPANRFPRVSLSQVLEGKVSPEFFRDRIVLIGSTAISLKDYFYTSYSSSLPGSHELEPMSGVELQANLLSQIISAALDGRPMIQVWAEPAEWLWIFAWTWMGAMVAWRLRSPLKTGAIVFLAILCLGGVTYSAFLLGWWIPLMPAAIGLVTAAMVIISYFAYLEEELKRSKEFLHSIINTIPDPIYVKDQQHRLIVANEAFCQLFGLKITDIDQNSNPSIQNSLANVLNDPQDQLVFTTRQASENEAGLLNSAGVMRQVATKRSLHQDAAGNIFLVGVMHDITERKRMEEELKRTAAELVRSNRELQQSANRLQYQATHDPLTGLPNRHLFEERLTQSLTWAAENDQRVALLFLDLDGFKLINDTRGHDIGDLLLKAVGQRLTRCLRGSDTVARLGGDEFTVILPAIPSAAEAAKVAEKILHTITQPFTIGGHVIDVTSSIGVSLYPHSGSDVETLVKAADFAMYQAKGQGKNRYLIAAPTAAVAKIEPLESPIK